MVPIRCVSMCRSVLLHSPIAGRLQGQPLSTLGPPPVDDHSPTLGRHPLTKPMGSDSSDFTRLIRSFHDVVLIRISKAYECGLPGIY